MAGKCDVLVSVGRLPVDVEVKCAVTIVDDVDVELRDFAILLWSTRRQGGWS